MRRLAMCVVIVLVSVSVLVPAVAWWAQGSNRKQLVDWFAGGSEQPAEPGVIQVREKPIHGIALAAALDMWVWSFQVDHPPDAVWKHAWLVVKKKGETID